MIVRLCLPQFAVGLFTTMLNDYLIYFYQPSKSSGIPDLIPQGRIVLGVLTIIGMIKAVGHIIDAVTDPLIAASSDKSKHKDGRRIPMMKKAAIPFGLCALLIFFVPFSGRSGPETDGCGGKCFQSPCNFCTPALQRAGGSECDHGKRK